MTTATAKESVEVLVALAAHRVDLAHASEVLACMPEITRRPQEVCPEGNPHECRVFGVTWWPPGEGFAGYFVCLAHGWVGNPTGPLSKHVPLPLRVPKQDDPSRRALALIPLADQIAWAVADGEIELAADIERQRRDGDCVLDDIALWVHQVIESYQPGTIMISSRNGTREADEEPSRLNQLGIRVRTRDLEGPLGGYRGFVLLERIVGVVYGVAEIHRPDSVYLSPGLKLMDSATDGEESSDCSDAAPFARVPALAVAAAAASALLDDREMPSGG